jgi:uncharacterized protein YjiS (DUF1127 family)
MSSLPLHASRGAHAAGSVGRPAVAVAVAVRDLAIRAVEGWRRRRRVAAGIAALRELDEHGLRDLGLDRGAIEDAARTGRR